MFKTGTIRNAQRVFKTVVDSTAGCAMIGKERRREMKGTKIAAVAAALTLTLGGLAFAGEQTVNLKVDGMSCGMCPAAVENALKGVEGVKSAQVTLEGGKAVVITDETVKETVLTDAVKSAGFKAQVVSAQ
jgi:copper chaperone CopZ